MKYALPLILLVAMAMPAIPQDAAIKVDGYGATQAAEATPISVVGPATAKAGETVTCTLSGTPAVDLAKPLTDQLAWLIGADRMYCYVAMPGHPMIPLDVEGTIVFGQQGATMRPQVKFGVADTGTYRLLVDWNFGQHQLAEHVVTVQGGPAPDPFPDPKPDPKPEPVPPGPRAVVIISESLNRTPQEVAISAAIRRYLAPLGVPFELIDPTTVTVDNWLAPYLAEVKRRKIALPALVLAVLPNPPTRVEPAFIGVNTLPGGVNEALAVVKEGLK